MFGMALHVINYSKSSIFRMDQMVIVGAGGFGREVRMLIEDINRSSDTPMQVLGFVDQKEDHQNENVRKLDILKQALILKPIVSMQQKEIEYDLAVEQVMSLAHD